MTTIRSMMMMMMDKKINKAVPEYLGTWVHEGGEMMIMMQATG